MANGSDFETTHPATGHIAVALKFSRKAKAVIRAYDRWNDASSEERYEGGGALWCALSCAIDAYNATANKIRQIDIEEVAAHDVLPAWFREAAGA